jgi:hypothetical protein
LCLNWWCLGHHRQRRLQLVVSRQPRSSGWPALEQHGITLVLAKDGAGRTRLEAGRQHEGTLAVEKTACATWRSRPRLDATSLGDAEGQHGDEESGVGEAAQRQGGLVTVKPVARGGYRGAGARRADGTRARRRVTAQSCPMLSEACGGLSSAPGCSTEQRRDRRRWVAPNADAEVQRQRCNALGPALRRLGWGLVERCWSSRTSGLGRRRWRRSSSIGGSSNQRVEGGPGTAWGGLELRFTRVHGRHCEVS